MKQFRRLPGVFCCLILITPWLARAGDIDSPAPPDDQLSAMFTLQSIFDRLDVGAVGAQRGALFQGPTSGPAASASANLNDIMGIAPLPDLLNGAAPAQVLSAHTFWGLDTNAVWGPTTGSMPNVGAQTITPGTATQTITQGFHNGSGSVAGDVDLASGNIRAGVNVFGVVGAPNVVDTTSGDAVAGDIAAGKKSWVDGVEITGSVTPSFPAAVGETGQTTCWDAAGAVVTCAGTGQDGDLKPGVAWPNPRFTNNGDGTVTDNLTGLIWLQDANCATISPAIWATAVTNANTLAAGFCGLTDSSVAGDWRLPSVNELQSLIDYEFVSPALSNAAGTAKWTAGDPFANVQNNLYSSSSSVASIPFFAWVVDLGSGSVGLTGKTGSYPVWAVRGGQ